MKLPKFLLDIFGAATKPAPTLPPVVYCFICHFRNEWIEPGVKFGCMNGHRFYVPGKGPPHDPLPPAPPSGGEI